MESEQNFTEGKIFKPLMVFALPILFALFLQAMYGAVDLFVVGRFATTADVSAVSTGSMFMQSITMVIIGLAMGITILVGQKIGKGEPQKAGLTIKTGIILFFIVGIITAFITVLFAKQVALTLQAPKEALTFTTNYIKICGAGSIFIVAYNLLGSIFRGIGNSKIPLITVAISCVINIALDLLFVAVFQFGTSGAAYATILAQAISVIISLIYIRHIKLPFTFGKKRIEFDAKLAKKIVVLGAPIALQDLLVGISFLVIMAIVNTMGVVASAGVGVAEKVCAFIMLVASAYLESMSAFVAQNIGAGKIDRAKKALLYGIISSFIAGIILGYLSFFHGDIMAGIFAKDKNVIIAAHSYLKAYSIDCLLTAFLFCFIGFYNGCGKTMFVMVQGIVASFFIRIPVAFVMSKIPNVSLFYIGLSTPFSTTFQILLCLLMYFRIRNKDILAV